MQGAAPTRLAQSPRPFERVAVRLTPLVLRSFCRECGKVVGAGGNLAALVIAEKAHVCHGPALDDETQALPAA